EAVSIACAVCDGLATAHAAQVIHRDIKPDNILIASDGRVVLADFGVAAVGVEGNGELSGTPAYMAPEQARGEQATPSSDVYAVAVVLFELVTGRRAFSGEMMTVLDAKQAVERVMPTDGEVPAELAQVIGRATAREPAQRIATAAALRAALQPWAKPGLRTTQPHRVPSLGAAGELTTIVVIAPDATVEGDGLYLAEAVHEELLARLSHLPRVRVLPRPQLIPDENVFGVCMDVVGMTLAVRVTHPTGAAVSLELPLAIERIQPDAEAIASVVGAAVRGQPKAASSQNIEAEELMLKARHLIQLDASKVPIAIELLDRAYAIAPDDPQVIANVVIARGRFAFFRPVSADDANAYAELARANVARHPELAIAQIAAGQTELGVGDPIKAARHFRAAIKCAPYFAEAHEQLGRMLLEAGYVDAALARLDDAIAIAPKLRSARWEIARARALEGNWDEYERIVAQLLAEQVDRPLSRARYAWWRQDWKQLAELRTLITAADRSLWPGLFEALMAAFLDGRWLERRAEILSAIRQPTASRRRICFISQLVAEAAVVAKDHEAAIDVITWAVDQGLFDIYWMDRAELLAPLRAHPRFAVLRDLVKTRADAIHDALYGDYVALSETQIA
ncbi:MAG TPA: protein kinase, partial [Kofleriaceae bacterium]|nr:protein kinase [Kofleriaceae bacterium]